MSILTITCIQLLRTTFWTRHDQRTLEQVRAGYDRPMEAVGVQTDLQGQDNFSYAPEDSIIVPGTRTSSIQVSGSGLFCNILNLIHCTGIIKRCAIGCSSGTKFSRSSFCFLPIQWQSLMTWG